MSNTTQIGDYVVVQDDGSLVYVFNSYGEEPESE
jgi:hypothetical protein